MFEVSGVDFIGVLLSWVVSGCVLFYLVMGWFRDVVWLVSILCVYECCIFSQMCIVLECVLVGSQARIFEEQNQADGGDTNCAEINYLCRWQVLVSV